MHCNSILCKLIAKDILVFCTLACYAQCSLATVYRWFSGFQLEICFDQIYNYLSGQVSLDYITEVIANDMPMSLGVICTLHISDKHPQLCGGRYWAWIWKSQLVNLYIITTVVCTLCLDFQNHLYLTQSCKGSYTVFRAKHSSDYWFTSITDRKLCVRRRK